MKIIILLFAFVLFSCHQVGIEGNEKFTKPNIIVILADDMGYSDLGCMGSEIQTPNLDRLANEGLLFTHCYNASRCCPSRASLLTGLYQHQAGIGQMVQDLGHPAYQGYLNDHCVTIAEVLGQNGYTTLMAGKWHVGDHREHWPDRRGFDHFFGIPKGGGLYFYPSRFIDRPIYRNSDLIKPDSTTFYSTDNFTTEALGFLSEQNNKEKPFFLYMAYIAPHFPLQAWPEDIAKYEGKYLEGYDDIREKRFSRQQKLGIIEQNTKLSPSEYSSWKDVNTEAEAHKMAVYAAMVDRMDQNVGRLIHYLETNGQLENTLIIFLSDNGASAENVNRSPGSEIGSVASFVSYGENWANVSNTPFRKYKSQEQEGGIATPLIVHWPNGISEAGRKIKDVVHIIDILPTCLEVADAKYPKEFNGKPIIPAEGMSFYPMLKNEKKVENRNLYWEHMGNKAIRINDKKLVKLAKKPWELYQLDKDPTELKNLAAQKPDLKDSLENLWNEWAARNNVMEWPVK